MDKNLKAFSDKYIANRQLCWEMDQQVMVDLSFSKWKEALIARSEMMRKIFLENERFLADIREELKAEITEEKAEQFLQILHSFYDGGYDDLFIMRAIAEPLLPYYEQKNDYPRILFLRKVLAYEYYEFYWRLSREDGLEKALELYEKTIEIKEHYAELTDPADRRAIFVSYRNIVAIIADCKAGYRYQDRMFRYLNDAMTFWSSDLVQSLDGDNAEFIEHIDRMETDVLLSIDLQTDMDEDFVDEYKALVKRLKENREKDGVGDDEGVLFRTDIMCRLLDKESPHQLIEEMIDHINSIGELDTSKENDALQKLLDYHNSGCTVFDIYKYAKLSKDEIDKYNERFIPQITNVHTHIPFGFWTGLIDNVCAEWFSVVSPYDHIPLRKAEMLMKLVLGRQPITYIHSLMVGEIATRIAIALIKDKPEYFLGVPGLGNLQQIKNGIYEISDYVTKCALLHDCGKCEIVEVVNRQHRHLYDEEYDVIKMHPDKGYEMLKDDPSFEKYFDIIRGHHKSYDGKTGYPASFNNLLSPYKAIIDLITVADCVDAATDILGRNYVKGKDFVTVYKELEAGSGTLYNPDIVSLIGQNKSLFEDLEYLTSEGRYEVYYRTYREIVLR